MEMQCECKILLGITYLFHQWMPQSWEDGQCPYLCWK